MKLFISINEPIDETPAGKLLEGIIEVIDEFYSANLARGMKEAITRGVLDVRQCLGAYGIQDQKVGF